MKAVLLYIGTALLQLHKGAFGIKLLGSLKLALPLSITAWCIEKVTQWTITNGEYMGAVLVCILIDWIVGSLYHALKLRDFTLKRNALGLLLKLSMCAGGGILFEIIQMVLHQATFAYESLKIITRLVVILYPAGSAFMNMSALTGGAFPPIGWIKKIKAFNENLDLDRFNNDKKEENEVD